MSAFIIITGSAVAGYTYDRRRAKKLKQEYIEQVRWMAKGPIAWNDEFKERVDVYAAKIPEDVENDRGVVFFKKYVKPILNAAGYEYTFTHGQIPGSIGRILLAKFKLHRLEDAASVPPPANALPDPSSVVLVGRNTLKEYLWALKKGYVDEINLDRELKIAEGDLEDFESKELAQVVDQDGLFPDYIPQTLPESASTTARFLPESSLIPVQPPILLLPFSHPLGSMLHWPKKWWSSLFGESNRVQKGAIAAFTLLSKNPTWHEIEAPSNIYAPGLLDEKTDEERVWLNEDGKMAVRKGEDLWRSRKTGSRDLDFDLQSERYLSSAFKKNPQTIKSQKRYYYDEMKIKLDLARALASGEKAPTQEQGNDPPLTEDQLHDERIRKEKTWKREDQGFRIIRQGSGMAWNEAFKSAIRILEPEETAPVNSEQSEDGSVSLQSI